MSTDEIIEKEGVVVMLDRLGTKGIWRDNNPQKVISDWRELIKAFDTSMKNLKVTYDYKFTAFSDTVIITATKKNKDDDIENLLVEVSLAATGLLVAGMASNIFFRGGLTVGKFFDPDQMIIGSAIDELAQYYTLPEWIGVSAAPTAHRMLDKIAERGEIRGNPFYRYDIPLKNSIEYNGWAVNWVPIAEETIQPLTKIFEYGKICNSVMEIVDDQLEKTNDVNISFKWRNTKNYISKTRINPKSDLPSKT